MNWVWLVLAAAAQKPAEAPVTSVTVFSDRARVTRTASVEPGVSRLEFPLLLDTVDPSSVRVESQGADVKRVDIVHVDAEEFPADEARALLNEMEKVSDAAAQARNERDSYGSVLDTVRRLSPAAPPNEPLKPTPRLNAAGWGGALAFVDDWSGRMQAKKRELDERLVKLGHREEELREKARILGGARRRSGFRITAMLGVDKPAKVTLTYEARGARWSPTYDIQLLPEKGRVDVSFSGQVSQETGEDWTGVAMTLSTAVPAGSAVVPKLLTWKVGQKDRFIPTATPLVEMVKPPPVAPPLPVSEREADRLRSRLLSTFGVGGGGLGAIGLGGKTSTYDFEDTTIEGQLQKPTGGYAMDRKLAKRRPKKEEVAGRDQPDNDADGIPDESDLRQAGPIQPAAPPPPPAAAPMAQAEAAPRRSRSAEELIVVTGAREGGEYEQRAPPAPPSVMSLSPPGGYIAPTFAADLAAAQAGGYALSYDALRPETVVTGKSARVALFTQSWPVAVERKLFPGLTQEAFLVAELKNPSPEPLPGGHANLFVGADPAGVAQLKLVSPQEGFTLPLGIDRAIKPVRNVKVVDAEKGVIGKDDLSEYRVTIEVANPYDLPIQTRIHDQWPITDDKNVEVKLLKTEPYATQDKVKGALEWRVQVPARGKTTVEFDYSIRRPKSWLLHQ